MIINDSNLKKGQISSIEATDWKENLIEEKEKSFFLNVPSIVIQKSTYEQLSNKNQNRIRVYLGLEGTEDNYSICAFAVSASATNENSDTYTDISDPIFKLTEKNENFSDKPEQVAASLTLYNNWRNGTIQSNAFSDVRQYIYPKAYLLGKEGLDRIFNFLGNHSAKLELGIKKFMEVMIIGKISEDKEETQQMEEVYDFTKPCPPHCAPNSLLNL